ncbi:hypothetical protein Hypma_016225 [Hypsizygus marmoreus]|uniref:Uncharacterized protein n=1 Tax=Hypsizygus marmoreus TaxID=39966 RepID=A0A369J1N2_HYPMA|nr:hypothetical protein Hypma_016225 [Hypsizygus marmoreus]
MRELPSGSVSTSLLIHINSLSPGNEYRAYTFLPLRGEVILSVSILSPAMTQITEAFALEPCLPLLPMFSHHAMGTVVPTTAIDCSSLTFLSEAPVSLYVDHDFSDNLSTFTLH